MKLKNPTIIKQTAAIIAFLSVLTTPCQAQIYHIIQKGENLAIVAKRYYGDPAKALLLMEYNGVSDPRGLNPGQRIVIPEVKVHRVKKGDTLALIAKKYLSDPNKSRSLAKLNQIKDPRSISPGITILIPVEILHTVRKGDSLASIAQRYYGDIDAFNLIALYNDIKDPAALKPGTRLILPIRDLKIITEEGQSQPSPQPKMQSSRGKGMASLEQGVSDYFMGDYLEAVKNLRKAVAFGLRDNDDISKAHRFLAYSYVALNEHNKAKNSFQEALKVDPELRLDPVYVSPKIIEVFQEVKDQKSGVRSQNREAKTRNLLPGSQRSEVRSQKSEVRSQNREAKTRNLLPGSQRSEVRSQNREAKTRNLLTVARTRRIRLCLPGPYRR